MKTDSLKVFSSIADKMIEMQASMLDSRQSTCLPINECKQENQGASGSKDKHSTIDFTGESKLEEKTKNSENAFAILGAPIGVLAEGLNSGLSEAMTGRQLTSPFESQVEEIERNIARAYSKSVRLFYIFCMTVSIYTE